jgi:hypothetical protein
LRLLTEVLTRDAAAARQSLAVFERLAASAGPGERDFKLLAVNHTRALVYKLYGSREQIAEGFRATVDAHAKQTYGIDVNVPDLVGLLGAAKAEALLVEALKKPVVLQVPEGVATKALARKLALRDVGSLRKPQWGLVDGMGTSALYEALQARFDPRAGTAAPEPAEEADAGVDYQRRQADLYYFLDLVIAGRHAQASDGRTGAARRERRRPCLSRRSARSPAAVAGLGLLPGAGRCPRPVQGDHRAAGHDPEANRPAASPSH